MKKQPRFSLFTTCVAMIAIGIMTAGSARADAWPQPAGGWVYEYVASAANGRPDQHNASWTRGYQITTPGAANYSGIVSDGAEGEVLQMIQGNTPLYMMSSGLGVGTTNDLLTLDIRFRLTDEALTNTTWQLILAAELPRNDGLAGRSYYFIGIRKDGLTTNPGGVLQTYMTAVDTNWHDLRILIDAKNNREDIFYDQAITPIVTGRAPLIDTAANRSSIFFGDGSTFTSGSANIKYIRWTRSELAKPIVHVGSADPVSEGWIKEQSLAWTTGSEEGTPYWQGIDAGTSLGAYNWYLAENAMDSTEGWTATAKVRVLSASTTAYAVAYLLYDGVTRWNMVFMPDKLYYYGTGGAVLVDDNLAAGEYHTYQCYYKPTGDGGNGSLLYYCNGKFKREVTRAQFLSDASNPQLRWGSINGGATSTQRWNYVEFAPGNRVLQLPTGTLIMFK